MPLIRLLLRLALVVVTVLVGLALMALALITLAGLFAWSLLRGRKPVVDLSGLRRARRHMSGKPGGNSGAGEVVDVEAREVPTAPARRLGAPTGE